MKEYEVTLNLRLTTKVVSDGRTTAVDDAFRALPAWMLDRLSAEGFVLNFPVTGDVS